VFIRDDLGASLRLSLREVSRLLAVVQSLRTGRQWSIRYSRFTQMSATVSDSLRTRDDSPSLAIALNWGSSKRWGSFSLTRAMGR